MVAVSTVPTNEQIAELRNVFHKRLQKDEPPGGLHPADLERINNEDFWLSRFLSYNDGHMDKASNQLWDTCIWRKEFGANDLTADNVRQDYRDSGLYFSRGRDLDGKAIFYFKCRLFIKGSRNIDELKKVLIYWIERTIRENDWDLITPTFDMTGCGLSNVDLSYLQYIISTFKTYYPDQINYIIVYDMAWILNATFQIIKKLLPPKAVERLRFVNSKSVKQLIDVNNMPVEWGGNDDYKFKFVPEKTSNNNNNTGTPNMEKIVNGNGSSTDSDEKKVHFAQNLNSPGAPETANAMAESHLLRVTPSEAIVFNKVDNDLCGHVKIQNIDSNTLTYKIKTTAPEKFRVKPSTGILTKGESVSITVVFNHGQPAATLSRDKFLVMCTPLASGGGEHDAQFLADFWKNTSSASPNVEQHRLRCNLAEGMTDASVKNGKTFESSFESATTPSSNQCLQVIQDQLKDLRRATRTTQTLQWITMALIFLLSIAMVYIIKFEIKNNSYEYCVRQ